MKPLQYIDRGTGERITESVMGNGALKFAYETLLGRTLWPVLFGSKAISALMGLYYDSRLSGKSIGQLAGIPGCTPEEAEKSPDEYESFNAFFTRRLKAGARPLGDGFTSPADGRLMLYLGADAEKPFPLKGATRSLKWITGGNPTARLEEGKYDIAVVRLAPVDYHRFHFPFDCETRETPIVLPGEYHSVNPIALLKRPDVYVDNERQVVACDAKFGRFWMIDVGAFGVGTIVQTYKGVKHAKGEERGYFKFGGSTVVVVTHAGALKFDSDLVTNSAAGLETRVRCGEHIAEVAATRE